MIVVVEGVVEWCGLGCGLRCGLRRVVGLELWAWAVMRRALVGVKLMRQYGNYYGKARIPMVRIPMVGIPMVEIPLVRDPDGGDSSIMSWYSRRCDVGHGTAQDW